MSECIALIRGVNVGRNKRLAMADLRGLSVVCDRYTGQQIPSSIFP
jgi:hypothetical protein